jgi:hypothetical protein
MCSWVVLFRETILAEWLRHFNDLAVGETAATANFSRENAEGAGMPPSRQGGIIEMTRHVDTEVNGRAHPVNTFISAYNKNILTHEIMKCL